MNETIHLCDLVPDAEIEAPSTAHVEVQPMEVGGVEEISIFEHPDSRVRFALPGGFRGGTLRLGFGIKTVAWENLGGAVTFRVGIEVEDRVRWLHRRTLDPRRRVADRAWARAELALDARATAIVLDTRARRGRTDHAWAGWADPVVEAMVEREPRARPRHPRTGPQQRPNILLITADACRADALGCYGNLETRTPNLDSLASDGLLFHGARANSTTTIGSYASLLTGLYAPNHGATNEWQPFPFQLPNLPTALARSGYHTIFVPSDREIAVPEKGFSSAFAAHATCVGNPNQDGALTTRSVLRQLATVPDRPWFCWVGYFDTHPPYRLPPRLLQPYYQGDPTSPDRSWRPELVGMLHGVESVVELDAARSLLRDGHVGGQCYIRLRDTVRALAGETRCRPDLAELLPKLAPASRRGMSIEDFVPWLSAQVAALARGSISRELMCWLDDVLACLHDVDLETLGSARGVLDYRFLLAQGRAAVAHLDDQVGALVRHLRDDGIYDDTTIVFCSPHGELFGEGGEYFDHLSPGEAVLRVPLVVKPGRGFAEVARGGVDGPFDIIDLLPTLLDGHGLGVPPTDGRSYVPELIKGRSLPPRDSFAVDADAVRAAVFRPPYKLVKARAWTTFEGCPAPPGSNRLYRITPEGETPADNDKARDDLEVCLDRWLAALPLEPFPHSE